MNAWPLVRGATAGCLATLPMTVAMELLHRTLPMFERYPLPPSEIVTATEEAGLGRQLDPVAHTVATLAAHFGYGALAGAFYGLLARRVRLPPLLMGIGFGMLVWGGSYLGLLPALGVLTPATEHPARRNVLMIAAHAVWGATLGVLFARIERPGLDRRQPMRQAHTANEVPRTRTVFRWRQPIARR